MKSIETTKAPSAISPYSQAVVSGGLLYLSGKIPIDPISGVIEVSGIEGQTEQAINNIESILKAAGTSFESIVKTTCYLKDMDDFAAFNNVYAKAFTSKPARSCVEVSAPPMMPRGATKLGLSRMNMGGAGAKMIRGIMKQKGISSLEELIESAKAHGVRLVACQMSMDIMGIHQEELLEGIELGGVSTFLGSGEESDMSLFI